MNPPAPHWLEARLAPLLFGLAVAFLVLLAILFHGRRDPEINDIEQPLLLGGLAVLWPIFWLDAAIRFSLRRPDQKTLGRLMLDLAPALLPPLRLGVRSVADPGSMWLPVLGWQKTGYQLLDHLQRTSGMPMILAALLILPLMVLEFGFEEQVKTHAILAITLQLGTGFVWLAFAFEYIVLASAAPRMLRYCVRHWLDFAIVVLPMLEFLPFARVLRLTRLMRLEQLGRMGRLYRLRGLAMKAWRAIILLNVVSRLMGRSLEKRLAQLHDQLADKRQEIEFLQGEITRLEALVAEQRKAKEAKLQTPTPTEAAVPTVAAPTAALSAEAKGE